MNLSEDMKYRTTIWYFLAPVLVSVSVFLAVLNRRSFNVDMIWSYLIGGTFFYVAPFLIWLIIALTIKTSNTVTHLGFIACVISLGLISSLWLLPPDPSGLPIQWMAYWPLSAILCVTLALVSFFYKKWVTANKGVYRD